MILELQIKYLREMEAKYIEGINGLYPAEGMCIESKIIGGELFQSSFFRSAWDFCLQHNIEHFNGQYWFPLTKEGHAQRLQIIRGILAHKEALLKECIH